MEENRDKNILSSLIDRFLKHKLSLPTIIAMIFFFLFVQYLFYFNYKKIVKPMDPVQTDSGVLGITTLITKVKNELIEAERLKDEKKEASMFILKDFDIEIQFMVKSVIQQSGKSDLQFVVVDTNTNVELHKLHKMKIHMIAAPSKKETKKAEQHRFEKTDKIFVD